MDQFELARQKTAEREARKARYAKAEQAQNIANVIPSFAQDDVPVVAKEKPRKNGVFTISVDMPHAQFTFSLVKQSILSHAPQGRLTEAEIRKHIVEGLKPLLGGID
jgi:hypothetical protein